MRLTSLALAFVLAAAPAAAQDALLNAWPLDAGNRWVFRVSSQESQHGFGSDAREGAVEWEVSGEIQVDGEPLPLVTITRTPLGGTPAEWVCAVRTRDADGVRYYDLVGADGNGECEADSPSVPQRYDGTEGIENGHFLFDPHEGVRIGGVEYPLLRTLFVEDSDFLFLRSRSVGEGVGPLSFSFGTSNGGFVDLEWAELLRAEVNGLEYGGPLDLGGPFVQMEPGDTWVYATRETGVGHRGFVTWTVVEEDGQARLRVNRTLGDQTTSFGTCDIVPTAPSPATGWMEEIRFVGDCTGGELFSLPLDIDSEERALLVDGYRSGAAVTVGGESYTADVGRWYDEFGNRLRVAEWEVARGIGVTRYAVIDRSAQAPVTGDWTMTLEYASVGGQTYGVMPVAADPSPDLAALAVRVGPNPVRGTATVWTMQSGLLPVVLEVVDVQGRVVQQIENAPSVATLDVSDLAPGVYVLRAESDGASVHERFVVAR